MQSTIWRSKQGSPVIKGWQGSGQLVEKQQVSTNIIEPSPAFPRPTSIFQSPASCRWVCLHHDLCLQWYRSVPLQPLEICDTSSLKRTVTLRPRLPPNILEQALNVHPPVARRRPKRVRSIWSTPAPRLIGSTLPAPKKVLRDKSRAGCTINDRIHSS